QAEVAVAAGDRDDGAGRKDAWSNDDTLVDGALEPERRPTHVANGGEPAHQRVRGLGPCDQVQIAEIVGEQGRRRGPDQHGMPMPVDEARHERTATTGYDLCWRITLGWERILRDLLDRVAANKNVHARGELVALAVEDANVLEQCECRRLLGVRGVNETKYGCEGRSPARHRILLSRPPVVLSAPQGLLP